jgi:signal transduction histidine kinase
MRLKDWLKPPRSLLAGLVVLTLVSVSAVSWAAFRVFEQERLIGSQRAQERLEEAADRAAANLRTALADIGDRLSAWLAAPPAADKPLDGLLLIFDGDSIQSYPRGRLLFDPSIEPRADADERAFSEGEDFEFLQGQPRKAAEVYAALAESASAQIRAGALMRLGRVWRRLGRDAESRSAYAKLAALNGVRAAGLPAELVARYELSDGRAIRDGLLAGSWPLSPGQFDFYWAEAQRMTGGSGGPPAEALRLAGAAGIAWRERQSDAGSRGHRTVWSGSTPTLLVWRGLPFHRAVLAMNPDAVLKQARLPAGVGYAAEAPDGRLVAGERGARRVSVRPAGSTQLPWNLYFSFAGAAGAVEHSRQPLFYTGLAVMALFLLAGTYLIARAIRKEAVVSRLQSDFVAAVSHEFRSPLTTMRQLSEMLAATRVASESRRQLYYETLVGESARLQRLVETLLNFGRMEAGARPYRFERLDSSALVERVAAEFEPQIAAAGRHIEVAPRNGPCWVDADAEALSLAVRNLVDNALKYSPDHQSVAVECESKGDYVAIRVRDRGAGIAASEQKAIFRKFVRGTAASAGNVKGTGVGLAMVRQIVDAHGGEVRVESRPGEGSTFTLLLKESEDGANTDRRG